MKLDVIYHVPVTVTVDTITKTVDKVTVDNERVEPWQGLVYKAGERERPSKRMVQEGRKVAREAEWPPWDNGY